MASIARQTARKLGLEASTTFRGLSTSAIALAAKGKAGKAPAPSKKAQQGFAKKTNKAGGSGGSGGGSVGAKNITLKYENALPAPDLSDLPLLHPETIRSSNVGTAAVVPSEAMERLRTFGLPRRLDKEFARGQAVSVIRDSTVHLAKRIDGVKSGVSQEKQTVVLAGERGAGKSTILLHAVTHALNSGWIVLYIPKASEMITSSSPYLYNATTQQFSQPALSSSILDKLIKVNGDALAKVMLTRDGSEESVLDMAKRGVGVDAGEGSVRVLRDVLAALGKQAEVPVMIAIDEVQALFSKSDYLTPVGGVVESYNLSAPALFLDYLMGKETLQSGLILTALSHSTPSLPVSPTLSHALSLPSSRPITPYTPLHAQHLAHASAIIAGSSTDNEEAESHGEVVEVEGYTLKEAAGVFGLLGRLGKTGAGAKGDEAYLSAMTMTSGNPLRFTRSIAQTLHA